MGLGLMLPTSSFVELGLQGKHQVCGVHLMAM